MSAGRRRCDAIAEGGEPCRAAPLHGAAYCFWHSPEHQAEAQEARRLGGLRRRREATVAGAYDFEGLATVDDVRRLLVIAVTDTLELANSVARNRTLAYLAQMGLRTLEVGELAERVAAIESAVAPRPVAQRGRR